MKKVIIFTFILSFIIVTAYSQTLSAPRSNPNTYRNSPYYTNFNSNNGYNNNCNYGYNNQNSQYYHNNYDPCCHPIKYAVAVIKCGTKRVVNKTRYATTKGICKVQSATNKVFNSIKKIVRPKHNIHRYNRNHNGNSHYRIYRTR